MDNEMPQFITTDFEEERKSIFDQLQPYIDQYTLCKLKLQQLPAGCKEQEVALRSMIGWCTEEIQKILKV